MSTGYEPLFTPKLVTDDVWVIDGPAIKFFGMPFSTRSTVLRLADGGLWVHSPIEMTRGLGAQVLALGPVRHLIAPNWIHYAFVGEWQDNLPLAKSWAAPGVVERAASRGMALQFDAELGQDAPPDWAGEIDQMIVRGSAIHQEAVFFHRASKTLILTDLIENFERAKLPWWMRAVTRLVRNQDPHGSMPIDMRATFRKHRDQLRADVERMIDWGPERVILSHGRWYEKDGVDELKRAFHWAL